MSPSTTSKVTTDHEEIRQWAEERGAKPAAVARTEKDDDPGIIRLDFPGYSGEGSLDEISWEEWFKKFDERNLALLYQETTAGGQKSNFNKIVSRETAQEAERGRGGRSSRTSENGSRASHKRASGSSRASASGSRAKRSSGASSRERQLQRKLEECEEGRETTARKSTSARGRSASTGRGSTHSRTAQKRSGKSRASGRGTASRSTRTTSRSAGKQASSRSSGSAGTRSRTNSARSSGKRSGSRSR